MQSTILNVAPNFGGLTVRDALHLYEFEQYITLFETST